MEQTLLETTLEKYLPTIGMKLESRVYADDKDFQAELEDTFTNVKSTSPSMEKLWAVLKGEISHEQDLRGEQIFLERLSEIFNGLGFCYRIFADTLKEKSARESADKIIKERRFGHIGSESLHIYYDKDEIWRDVNPRNKSQMVKRFYSDISKLDFCIFRDNKIFIVNKAKKDDYDNSQKIRGVLEVIETEFNEKYLDEYNIKKLMGYLKELKECVD